MAVEKSSVLKMRITREATRRVGELAVRRAPAPLDTALTGFFSSSTSVFVKRCLRFQEDSARVYG